MSLAFIGAVVASTKAASDFQTQMQFVNTMLDDNSTPILERFTIQISDLSKEFGESTKTLTSGMFDILSATIDAADATDVLAVASKAAVGGLTDVATTTSALLTIINSYGMEAEDATEISDKMFASLKRGRFVFGQLAESIGRVAATANLANLSLDGTLTILAATTRNGINMNEAVTSLNSVLRAFLSPTNEAQEAAAEFGLELSSNTLKTIGLSGAVKKLKGATAEQLATILPNIRGFKALATAVGDLEGLQKDLALISEDAAGRTEKAFAKMADTVGFKTKRLKQQVIAVGRSLGRPMLDPLSMAIDTLRGDFGELETLLDNNADSTRELTDLFVNLIPEKLKENFQIFKLDVSIFGPKEAVQMQIDLLFNIIKTEFESNRDVLVSIGKFMGTIMAEAFVSAFISGIKTIFTPENIKKFLTVSLLNNPIAIANRVDLGLPPIATPGNRAERQAGRRPGRIFNNPKVGEDMN